jgi:hypothetical protein
MTSTFSYAATTARTPVQATRDLGGPPRGPWAGPGALAAYAERPCCSAPVLFRLRDA